MNLMAAGYGNSRKLKQILAKVFSLLILSMNMFYLKSISLSLHLMDERILFLFCEINFSYYSFFIDFTGLSFATCQLCKVTVTKIMIPTTTNESRYTHQYIGVL